jgi:hypothetical protein
MNTFKSKTVTETNKQTTGGRMPSPGVLFVPGMTGKRDTSVKVHAGVSHSPYKASMRRYRALRVETCVKAWAKVEVGSCTLVKRGSNGQRF